MFGFIKFVFAFFFIIIATVFTVNAAYPPYNLHNKSELVPDGNVYFSWNWPIDFGLTCYQGYSCGSFGDDMVYPNYSLGYSQNITINGKSGFHPLKASGAYEGYNIGPMPLKGEIRIFGAKLSTGSARSWCRHR